MKRLLICLLLLVAATVQAVAIDREAFTSTRYQLEVQVDRATHVMVVTGKLTLRNDSKTPQKVIALQVSSALNWNSITLDDKPLQWLSDTYTSDIDHTGGLDRGNRYAAERTAPDGVAYAGCPIWRDDHAGRDAPDANRRSC